MWGNRYRIILILHWFHLDRSVCDGDAHLAVVNWELIDECYGRGLVGLDTLGQLAQLDSVLAVGACACPTARLHEVLTFLGTVHAASHAAELTSDANVADSQQTVASSVLLVKSGLNQEAIGCQS